MFKQDKAFAEKTMTVTLDGKPVSLPEGISVAAGLLAIGELVSRVSPTSEKPCSPNCLMGVCYECWMEIDGIKRQACLTPAREGMVIERYLNDTKGDRT